MISLCLFSPSRKLVLKASLIFLYFEIVVFFIDIAFVLGIEALGQRL